MADDGIIKDIQGNESLKHSNQRTIAALTLAD